MTPAQLDILFNGAFIYQRPDGTSFASIDYKLGDYGMKLLRRAGKMTEADLAGSVADYLARLDREAAA